MRPTDPKVTLTGTWIRDTDKAVQFQVTHISGEPINPQPTEWFPFSQMSKSLKNPKEIGADVLIVSEWICYQKPALKRVLETRGPDPEDDDGAYDGSVAF